MSYELTQNGQPYDPQVFTLDENNGALIIDTADTGSNGQIFDFEVTVTDSSGNVVIEQFSILLEDKCETATLTGP